MNLKELFNTNNNKLEIKVIPNASSDKVIISEDNVAPLVKVYVTVTPEDGKANKQVIKLLSNALKIPKSKINISKGLKSKNKTVVIEE